MNGRLLEIHNRMIERGLDEHYCFAYSFPTPQKSTKRRTRTVIKLLATADIVVTDDYVALLGRLSTRDDFDLVDADTVDRVIDRLILPTSRSLPEGIHSDDLERGQSVRRVQG